MVCAKEIQKKYDSEGPVGYLLGATEFAISNLKTISALDIVRKNNAGDLVTAMDRSVHGSVIQYFREIGLSVAILGEEGQHQTANPQWAILIDEIEGTQNAVNQLPYGINMAIAPWRERIQVGDLESSVVTNLYDERIFVGEKAKGAYKIVCGERRELDRTQTDVYECPSPNAYTTSDEQAWRQGRLAEIFKKVIGNQPRSIDATGTRLVELADSNICAYGDWRNATKCWDVLPSALIIQEAGYVLTDSLGFDLSNAVFYDKNNPNYERDGGLNRRVGENFIAASSEVHKSLIYPENWDDPCTWDIAIDIGRFIQPHHWRRSRENAEQIVRYFKETVSRVKILENLIEDKTKAYGEFDYANLRKVLPLLRAKIHPALPNYQMAGMLGIVTDYNNGPHPEFNWDKPFPNLESFDSFSENLGVPIAH